MPTPRYMPRLIQSRLERALSDTPVVLVHGPRQCGKTTLVQHLGRRLGYDYISFDDEPALAAAREDPVGFVHRLGERVVLDEIQRVPDLFLALKSAVDRERVPGRFLLTGSTNILLLPELADSLAGRIGIIRLHPLAVCERLGRGPTFLEQLFSGSFGVTRTERLDDELARWIVAGGYPEALGRSSGSRRRTWYLDYIEAVTQRDIRELSRIQGLEIIPNLMAMAAAQSGQLYNVAELAGPFRQSQPTIGEYMTLLENIFQITRLPSWHGNRLSRLVKTPKLHLVDTGIGCALLDLDADDLRSDRKEQGRLLETFVLQELRRQSERSDRPLRFHHFRDRDGAEVDIVMESGPRKIAGVEVKLSSTVRTKDFKGLRKLQRALDTSFMGGAVLYDGEETLPFGEGLWAVPLRRALEGDGEESA